MKLWATAPLLVARKEIWALACTEYVLGENIKSVIVTLIDLEGLVVPPQADNTTNRIKVENAKNKGLFI